MRVLRPGIGFAISALAVYLLARGVDWEAVGRGLRDADHVLIAATIPVMLLLFAMRAFRWHLLFRPEDGVGVWPAFKALNVGYMAGNILPLQMGELARVYALGEETRVPKARVLSTVAVERVLDVVVLLIGAAVLGPIIGIPAPAVIALVVVVFAALAAVAVIVVAVVDRPRAERWSDILLRFSPAMARPKATQARNSMLDGVATLSDMRRLAAVIAWTIASWAVSAVVIYMLLQALNVDVPVSAAPFLLIVTTLAFFIPSSPGAVGVYDAAAVTALVTGFDVDRELATSYALVAHACYLAPATVLGAVFFWSMHLRLPDVAAVDLGEPAIGVDELAPATGPR